MPADKAQARVHTVGEDESLARIASQYGFKSWKALWDAPENSRLRARRKSPHVLYARDQVAIPALDIREIVRSTNDSYRVVLSEPEVRVRLRVQDLVGKPIK